MHPMSYTIGFAKNKVFHLGQILKQDDQADFAIAMEKEVEGYNKGKHWELIWQSETLYGLLKQVNRIKAGLIKFDKDKEKGKNIGCKAG